MRLEAVKAGENFQSIARWHTYSLGHMHLMLSLVLSAAASIRGTSKAAKIMFESFGIKQPVPSWYSVRVWLLRLGYYKLTRKKEHAKDWIWIIDHTIQCGREKCLAILGIRQSRLPESETTLYHEDLEPLALYPVTRSNGEIVYQQLKKTIAITGVPREIIADGGTDIKSGVEHFCNRYSQTCFVYDIKHKAATILKQYLNGDSSWNEFAKQASSTGKQLQQTDLAALAPPNQRSKSRYMNIDRLVKWAHETLVFMDQQTAFPSCNYDHDSLKAKLGWLSTYRCRIARWQEVIHLIEIAVDYIRFQGFYRGCQNDLAQELFFEAHSQPAISIREDLLAFIKNESDKAEPHERLLGSSEVIESVFGKLKFLENDQSKSGFTALLLSLAACLSTTTIEVIRKAMETVPTKKVFQWFKDNIGQSVQSKRKEVKKTARQAEQFWDLINA